MEKNKHKYCKTQFSSSQINSECNVEDSCHELPQVEMM